MSRALALTAVAVASFLTTGCAHTSFTVGSGIVSHNLCSEVFVSGLSKERALAESIAPRPGFGVLGGLLRTEVDAERGTVTSRIAGGFTARSLHRPGLGCLLLRGAEPPPVEIPPPGDTPPLLPELAGPAVVEPTDARLVAALERAFAEPAEGPRRNTRAVVVVHEGRIVAERYADGIGIETPLLGYSATKSVVSALVGILVREGKLTVDAPAPVAAWSDPDDPRHAITVDHLLRMTSGLALAESGTPWSPVARMLYLERDMAAFAAGARLAEEPGREFAYTSGSTLLLSAIVKDAAGGRAEDVLRFARRELFDPLGMKTAVLELDATGTPVGSTYLLASARDWARFGQLYLDDGVAGGRRILPEGWVRSAATPTLATGYGAGFWTNHVPGPMRGSHIHWGLPGTPQDTFHARGLLGQYVVVVPSQRLVVVRLGAAVDGDQAGVARLVAEVVELLGARR